MDVVEQVTEIESLVKQCESCLGRPLRVLHIGNIANNAYINAKIMRRFGIEADVMCDRYYHIMGCPEWEDVECDTNGLDHNFPDWTSVDLQGYKRPEWFYQGEIKEILLYALARQAGCVNKMRFHSFINRLVYAALSRFTKWRRRYAFIIVRLLTVSPWSLMLRIIRKLRGELRGTSMLHKAVFDKSLGDPGLLNKYKDDLLLDLWSRFFSYYDVIQGYATANDYPEACNFPYFSYSHGTIRELPFEETSQGRVCRVVYEKAEKILITNSDCLPMAKELRVNHDDIIKCPHAFDSKKAFDFYQTHKVLLENRSGIVTFIAPARHHWLDDNIKGNDVIINAVKLLVDRGIKVKVIFVLWGKDIESSKQLISKLSIDECFDWIEPVSKKKLWAYYMQCNAVIDQFVYPAMGGVGFESLALGARLLTKLDLDQVTEFFGEPPPCYESSDPHSLAEAMHKIVLDPKDKAMIGDMAQAWIQKYHSSEVILLKQLRAYHEYITHRTTIRDDDHRFVV